eukprot:GHVU01129981.1.p1 GENE.GHVU01129981.1~~GHVU01129981.1.p1  ORF type:complete len:326 (+),score=11.15 GHVU01129981.1:115-1092(+)
MKLLENVLCIGGIYGCFLLFGVTQEQLYRHEDEDTGQLFTFGIFLVWLICAVNTILAMWVNLHQSKYSFTQLYKSVDGDCAHQLMLTSLTYTISMLATNYALTHVSYPTQILVKSAKMVPIIVGGLIFFGRRYPVHDYVAVVAVTCSLILFNSDKMSSKKGGDNSLLGLMLLLVSLICDGLTGPRQDKLMARKSVGATTMMMLTNGFSLIWGGVAFLVVEHVKPIQFCYNNPNVIPYIAATCLSAALGQLFIFQCLKNFGSLHLALITTTRKFFSVLLSAIWFRHSISRLQWVCVLTIFGALGMQAVYSKKSKKHHHHSHAHKSA